VLATPSCTSLSGQSRKATPHMSLGKSWYVDGNLEGIIISHSHRHIVHRESRGLPFAHMYLRLVVVVIKHGQGAIVKSPIVIAMALNGMIGTSALYIHDRLLSSFSSRSPLLTHSSIGHGKPVNWCYSGPHQGAITSIAMRGRRLRLDVDPPPLRKPALKLGSKRLEGTCNSAG
jgi:hypothetical protein